MEKKEVRLEVQKLKGIRIVKAKEKWHAVNIDGKEFLMPKKAFEKFTGNMYDGSYFYLYFDGNNVITDDKYHIPVGLSEDCVKEYRFIVVDEDTELWRPEDYVLIGKSDGLAVYATDAYNYEIMYKKGKRFTILFRYEKDYCKMLYKQEAEFEIDKPLNRDTFELIKRIHLDGEAKYTVGFDVSINVIDDNVDVYVGENHYIMVIDNAEIVRKIDYGKEKLIAIKGNKTYINLYQVMAVEECMIHNNRIVDSSYRMFDYDLKEYRKLDVSRTVSGEKARLFEISGLDTDITVEKLIIDVIPVPVDQYWHYEKSMPMPVEEKTYKVRDLVKKLDITREGMHMNAYNADICLAVNA